MLRGPCGFSLAAGAGHVLRVLTYHVPRIFRSDHHDFFPFYQINGARIRLGRYTNPVFHLAKIIRFNVVTPMAGPDQGKGNVGTIVPLAWVSWHYSVDIVPEHLIGVRAA